MRQVNHEYYMREALKEAQKAFEADEVPVGAIIVVQERIIARSHNLTELLKDPTAHAEMQAIASLSRARAIAPARTPTRQPMRKCSPSERPREPSAMNA